MDTTTVFALFKCQLINARSIPRRSAELSSTAPNATSRVTPTRVLLHSPDHKPINVWDDVRYLLELRFGLHRSTARGQQCYFTGMLLSAFVLNQFTWDDKYRLMPRDVIRSGAHADLENTVLLWRRPLHSALAKYVPARFCTTPTNDVAPPLPITPSLLDQPGADLGEKTEDEKLMEVMMTQPHTHDNSVLKPRNAKYNKKRKLNEAVKHPSDYELNESRQPRPPPTYACNQCNMYGHHFRSDCPRYKDVYDDDGQLVKHQRSDDHVGIAHGIPKRFLKKVEDTTPNSSSRSPSPPLDESRDDLTVTNSTAASHTRENQSSSDTVSTPGTSTTSITFKLRTSNGELVTDQRVHARARPLTHNFTESPCLDQPTGSSSNFTPPTSHFPSHALNFPEIPRALHIPVKHLLASASDNHTDIFTSASSVSGNFSIGRKVEHPKKTLQRKPASTPASTPSASTTPSASSTEKLRATPCQTLPSTSRDPTFLSAPHASPKTLLAPDTDLFDTAALFYKPLKNPEVKSFGFFQHHLEYSSSQTDDRTCSAGFWFDIENNLTAMDDDAHAQREAFYLQNPEMREKLRSMCTHWLRGLCQKEWSCEYLHQYNVDTMPICKFFLHSKCEHGQECVFRHVLPPSTLLTNPCLDFALGFCAQGPTCSQQHLKRAVPSRADFATSKDIFEIFIKLFTEKR
jgi:cleavage and polyadenylation specificity factor subunit 4